MRVARNLLLALLVFDGMYHAFVRVPLREHLKTVDHIAIAVNERGTIHVYDREPTASNDPFLEA